MYKFDRHTLEFIKISWPSKLIKTLVIGTILLIALFIYVPWINTVKTNHEVKVIIAKQNEFSEEKLIKLIESLNFPFPKIVYAQAILETGGFTSSIYKENNNLFGMKRAVVRITTSKGESKGHAYYDNWMESVFDYALYSATYLSNIKTEEEYFSYLSQFYAEDKEYVKKLKNIIERVK